MVGLEIARYFCVLGQSIPQVQYEGSGGRIGFDLTEVVVAEDSISYCCIVELSLIHI